MKRMKKQRMLVGLALCAALLLFQPAGLQAQVHIGDTDASAKGGTLLDLTSTTAQRGLLPLNVEINNVNRIPYAFTDSAVITVPNEDLKGLIVYNTNATLAGGDGEGLYVWDGEQWSKIGCIPPAAPTLVKTDVTTIILNATTTITCGSVEGATSYVWTLPDGLSAANWTTTTNSITVTGVTPDTYNINRVTVKAVNDCGESEPPTTGSGDGTIVVLPCTGAPTIASPASAQSYTVNSGVSQPLSATFNANGGNLTYQWQRRTNGDWESHSSGSAGTTALSTAGTTTYYRCIATNECGATESVTFTVVVRSCSGAPTPSLACANCAGWTGTSYIINSTLTISYFETIVWTKGAWATITSGCTNNTKTCSFRCSQRGLGCAMEATVDNGCGTAKVKAMVP
ncbi:MAG: hypothetical protein LBO74_14785 [Candidatus Symbiothrix sp.]|nr:hypothetical protein [Candidatus Symbiothrix sp.]